MNIPNFPQIEIVSGMLQKYLNALQSGTQLMIHVSMKTGTIQLSKELINVSKQESLHVQKIIRALNYYPGKDILRNFYNFTIITHSLLKKNLLPLSSFAWFSGTSACSFLFLETQLSDIFNGHKRHTHQVPGYTCSGGKFLGKSSIECFPLRSISIICSRQVSTKLRLIEGNVSQTDITSHAVSLKSYLK